MAEFRGTVRPLSPHLQVWRWHVTMLGSILHRACLAGLYVGALILVGWLASIALGRESFEGFTALLGSLPGKALLAGLTFAVFFSLASTLRHTVWDLGKGLSSKTADALTVASLILSAAATASLWILAAGPGLPK